MRCDVQAAFPGGGSGQLYKMLMRLETWPLKGQLTPEAVGAGPGRFPGPGVGWPYREPAHRAVPDATDSPPRRLRTLSSFTVGETEVQKSGDWGHEIGRRGARIGPRSFSLRAHTSDPEPHCPRSGWEGEGQLGAVVIPQLTWQLLQATLPPGKKGRICNAFGGRVRFGKECLPL